MEEKVCALINRHLMGSMSNYDGSTGVQSDKEVPSHESWIANAQIKESGRHMDGKDSCSKI